MIYLHEKQVSDTLIRHWANESESASNQEAVYRIRQIETGNVYDDAIDVVPCRYTYDATRELVEISDVTPEEFMEIVEKSL